MPSRKKIRKATATLALEAQRAVHPTPDAWLADLVRAAEAFWGGPEALAPTVLYHDPAEAALRVTWLCENAHRFRPIHGDRKIGRALQYLMGSGLQVWLHVLRAEQPLAEGAVRSLSSLYRDVFATLPFSQDPRGPLESVGYMLWDMDGGLARLPAGKGPRWLTRASHDVLAYALSLDDAPACWYGALHGLGHAATSPQRRRVTALIDAFVAARRHALCPFFAAYAAAAREGLVQ